MNNARFFAITLAAATVAVSIPAIAQTMGAIETRQALMKQNGKDAKAGGAMLKGEVPFDPAKAQAIFASMHDVSMKFGNYFPADSKAGKTEASPAIWAKPAEFKAALAKFEKDTAAAVAAKPATPDAFKAQFIAVTTNCKSCHESFRVKTN